MLFSAYASSLVLDLLCGALFSHSLPISLHSCPCLFSQAVDDSQLVVHICHGCQPMQDFERLLAEADAACNNQSQPQLVEIYTSAQAEVVENGNLPV